MKYTLQLYADSGNWAWPQADDVRHANSKAECRDLLNCWADTVEMYSERQCAFARVWIGDYDETTDLYPDFELTIGPREGIRWSPC